MKAGSDEYLKGAQVQGNTLTMEKGNGQKQVLTLAEQYTLTKEDITRVLGFTPTKITAGTEDLIPGSSKLESGTVYLVYSAASTASAASSDEVINDTDIHLPEPETEEPVPDEEVVAP